MSLVAELKGEHEKILSIIGEIKFLGATSEPGRRRLAEIGPQLINHLKREELQLYPRLHVAAMRDSRLHKALGFFAAEVRELLDFTTRFFNETLRTGDDLEVAQQFGTLCGQMLHRIRHEETVIFREFEKVAANRTKPVRRQVHFPPL